jgi:hypothetical protein
MKKMEENLENIQISILWTARALDEGQGLKRKMVEVTMEECS